MFGPHLTLDLYKCNSEKLSDINFVKHFLFELPDLIGMTRISEPFVMSYPGRKGSFDKGGISGFVIIAESHISIHTFVSQEYASIDIFSCKNFDVNKAENFIVSSFGAEKVEKGLLNRGKHFSKNIEKTAVAVLNQRKGMMNEKISEAPNKANRSLA